MIHRPRIALCVGLLLLAAGCASSNNPQEAAGDPNATAPSTSTDSGSRYLDPAAPIGGLTVETPPVDSTWTSGQTSIARPAGGAASGSPDGGMGMPAQPMTQPSMQPGGLPQPGVRRTPPPPPPPPLR